VALVVALLVGLVGVDQLAGWADAIGSGYAEVVPLEAHVDWARTVLTLEAVVNEVDP